MGTETQCSELLLFRDYTVRCIFEFFSFLEFNKDVFAALCGLCLTENINKVLKYSSIVSFPPNEGRNEIRIGKGERSKFVLTYGRIMIVIFTH